ncbi:hypothetical protein F4677DRAFT_145585 [Hypoxylon crocopeplum]|nr:hypothetical protein F4677DRAFT_145585 [Hypoxylon crocopeplum]
MQSYHYSIGPDPAKGKEPATKNWSTSSQPLPHTRGRPLSYSTFVRPQTTLNTTRSLGTLEIPSGRRSNTWTSSCGDRGLLSEGEGEEDRGEFVHEYNRLAKRYGIRQLVPGDFPLTNASKSVPSRRGSWFSKTLRRTSSGQSTRTVIVKSEQRELLHRRSFSDVASNLVHHPRKDGLKDENLQDLVRLCGKSLLYLPSGYTPCSLVLPTCFRALAQALVQQADTRGIFRVPGSVRVVDTLYNYYCAGRDANDISTTTRCPNLPNHIKYSVHDVASAFKRLLAGLPGGILGSLSLFDALVAIHNQLHADPELTQTRETKLRARLIALAIGTVKSQYQRELICAVFGLLCFIGRTAENAPREDENERPLPTADLMGYNALSIVFGPLLVNDLINSYSMKVADPAAGLVLLPVSPPKSRKERRKHKSSRTNANDSTTLFAVDKIRIANCIAEMLIVHWREVVRQMQSLGTLKVKRHENTTHHRTNRFKITSSASESFSSRKPPAWNDPGPSYRQIDRSVSPMSTSPTPTFKTGLLKPYVSVEDELEPLSIKRRRSRHSRSSTSHKTFTRIPANYLPPTAEESPSAEEKTSRSTKQVESPEGPFRVNENLSILHNRNPSDHILSGSELTFHSVRSYVPGVSNYEESLSRSGNGTPKGQDPTLPGKLSPKPTPVRSPLSIKELSNGRVEDYLDSQERDTSPADQWKAITLASKSSTESLAKAMKERRLRRSPGYGSFRQSEESLVRGRQPASPEWKRQPMNKKNINKQKPARLSPEKKSMFEKSSHSRNSAETASLQRLSTQSPAKSAFHGGTTPVLKRSSSRPINGAVKAIASLFENADKGSPSSSLVMLTGRIGGGFTESSSILSQYSRSNSPSKSIRTDASLATSTPLKTLENFRNVFHPANTPTRQRGFAPSTNHSHLDPASPRTTPDTQARFSRVSLRSTGSPFFASRKVPLSSPTKQVPRRDRELSQPPSLGTMVPHVEEPPVAQHISFIRPSPATPLTASDEIDGGRVSPESPRPGSSNSMLHAQIRNLQRQLEMRAEEINQLRRQLEAHEHVDIGGLLEQLRVAKHECKMWRARAQAAEKRVTVFEQFTARVRGLRDTTAEGEAGESLAGEGQVDGSSHDERKTMKGSASSSSSSEHTENPEQLRDRIRRNMKKWTPTNSMDGSHSGGSERDGGPAQKKGLWERKVSGNRTAQLWDIAEEFLLLDGSRQHEG